MKYTYKVEVVERSSGVVVKSIPAAGQRDAERIERGININIGVGYYTRIVSKDTQ